MLYLPFEEQVQAVKARNGVPWGDSGQVFGAEKRRFAPGLLLRPRFASIPPFAEGHLSCPPIPDTREQRARRQSSDLSQQPRGAGRFVRVRLPDCSAIRSRLPVTGRPVWLPMEEVVGVQQQLVCDRLMRCESSPLPGAPTGMSLDRNRWPIWLLLRTTGTRYPDHPVHDMLQQDHATHGACTLVRRPPQHAEMSSERPRCRRLARNTLPGSDTLLLYRSQEATIRASVHRLIERLQYSWRSEPGVLSRQGFGPNCDDRLTHMRLVPRQRIRVLSKDYSARTRQSAHPNHPWRSV